MTAFDAAGPPPAALVPSVPSMPPPGYRAARFLGSEGAFFGLLVRGSLLLMLTLGIYRFWFATDVRRFLWGNTEIAGDGLEYTGTARELLIGFLMAIALLLPINGLIFIGTLAPSLLPYSGTAGFVLLALLGQFAFFRARRYRLTRTVFRGVRLYQTGSAWNYSVRSNLWTILIVLTAGLAYPWAQANLERYKLRHTHFGDLDGRFEGSGTRLFFRGFLLWLIVVGPFLAGLVMAVVTVNWSALVVAITAPGDDMWTRIENSNPDFAGAFGLLIAGTAWAMLAAAVLYPVFRAMTLRWWASGLRVGGVTATSRLRTGQIYKVYARFIGFSLLFGLAAGMFGGLFAGLYFEVAKSIAQPFLKEIAAVVLGVIGYIAVMLGYSAIYQGTVTIRLWRLAFETTDLVGLEALDHVQARGAAGGPLGEGLADALDVGGL